MTTSADLPALIARHVADRFVDGQRQRARDPDKRLQPGAVEKIAPLLHDAVRAGLEGALVALGPGEQIVDYASSYTYKVGLSTSVHVLLLVATTHQLLVVEHDDGAVGIAGYPWETVQPKRKRLSIMPKVEVAGGACVVTGPGSVTDWLEGLRAERPQEPVGRVAELFAAPAAAPAAPAAWLPDPTRRHQLRWWDGQRWTPNVADNGVQATDPL